MILNNVNAVVWRQVKSENSSLPVAVRVSKTRVLNIPNIVCLRRRLAGANDVTTVTTAKLTMEILLERTFRKSMVSFAV